MPTMTLALIRDKLHHHFLHEWNYAWTIGTMNNASTSCYYYLNYKFYLILCRTFPLVQFEEILELLWWTR